MGATSGPFPDILLRMYSHPPNALTRDRIDNNAPWGYVQKLREFLDAVQSTAIRKSGAVDPTSRLGRWLTWARSYLDSIDPVERLVSS